LIKKNFIQIILFILSILILIYTFYKSEIVWLGDKRSYYFTYYLLSFIIFSLSVLYLFLNNKTKQVISISLICCLFSLYLFEAFKTYEKYKIINIKTTEKIFLNKKIKEYFTSTGKKFDTRDKSEVYKDLKKANNNVVMAVYPSLSYMGKKDIDIFPLAGISNSRTIHCNENGFYSLYNSDRYGFNNPDKVWDSTNIDYILIGDSFVHGDCVNRPNDIASVIRNLSKKNVINLGYGSNGPLLEFATLKEYFNKKVKNVIWFYYEENDNQNLLNEIKDEFLLRYISDKNFSQNLSKKQVKINLIVENEIKNSLSKFQKNQTKQAITKKHERLKLYQFFKLWETRILLNNYLPENSKPSYSLHPKLDDIFRLTKEFLENNNTNFYVVYLPRYQLPRPKIIEDHYLGIKNITNKYSIPLINIYDFFDNEDDPLKYYPFRMRGHFNEVGYKNIGNIVYNYVKEH
jgi:hypothetical protein